MRSAGAIFRKLKEVKYKHLVVFYRQYLRKSPLNCKYNYKYMILDGNQKQREIRLCLFNQNNIQEKINPILTDICEENNHSSNCNAYVFKYSKEDIKKMFEKELTDIKIKSIKYPEICALEWVLERNALIVKSPNIFEILYHKIKNIIGG